MAERFIVDDAGTLIDLVSRDTYDYVSDVCPVLNKLVKENEQLKIINKNFERWFDDNNITVNDVVDLLMELTNENEQLKQFFKQLKGSGYWNDDYLTEQDWFDVKQWIERVCKKGDVE